MPLMGIPSISELIIIFGVVFLLFGAKKLPELGGAIGESIKNFKKGIRDDEAQPVDPNHRLAEGKPMDPSQTVQTAAKVENTPITPKD